MSFFGWARVCAAGVVLCLLLSGCMPPGDNTDEKKDPNFIEGKNLVSQMDWNGAIEAFEKALDANPKSASAHFELGWLYGEKANDPSAAIYHYQRYLKLSPNSDKADVVKQFINTYKLELVKSVSAVGPLPSGAQRELERVLAENKSLQEQVAQLQAQVAQWKAAASAARAQPPSNPVNPGNSNPNPIPNPIPPVPKPEPIKPSGTVAKPEIRHGATELMGSGSSGRSVVTGTRTHVVKSHETMAAIARQYGVSLAALQAANPQVRPTHLVVGQSLKIPAP